MKLFTFFKQPNDVKLELAGKIKHLRKKAGYTQQEGYPFQFGGNGNFSLDLFKNLSALKQHFVREQKNVEQLCADFGIADQSSGFFRRKVPSILITHPLNLPLSWWEKRDLHRPALTVQRNPKS